MKFVHGRTHGVRGGGGGGGEVTMRIGTQQQRMILGMQNLSFFCKKLYLCFKFLGSRLAADRNQ